MVWNICEAIDVVEHVVAGEAGQNRNSFCSFSNAWKDFLQCNYLCKFLFFMIQVAHLKEKIDRMLNGKHASLIFFLQSISYLRLWEIGVQYFFFPRRNSLSFMNIWGVLLDFFLYNALTVPFVRAKGHYMSNSLDFTC